MNITFTTEIPTAESLYELYDEFDWNNFLKLSPERLKNAMEQSFMSLYAYDEKNLVAMGRIVSDGVINAYLCGLCVISEYQNRGIGKEITKRLSQQCKEQGLHLQLFCDEALIPYYEKLGFERFVMGMKFV